MSRRAGLLLALLALLAGPARAQVSTGGAGVGGGMGGGGSDGAGPPAVTALATGLAPTGQRGDGQRGGGPQAPPVAPPVALPVALVGRADGRLSWARLDLEDDRGPLPEDEAGRLPGTVVGVAVAPDGAGWALDDAGGLYRLARGGEPTLVATHPGGAQALALAPDGRLAATGGNDGVVRVWGAEADSLRDEVAALDGHQGPVAALCWTEAGLWSAGWDGEVRAWSARGRRLSPRGRPTRASARELCALAPGPDGLLLAGGFDGALSLVDPGKRKSSTWPERPNPELVRALATSSDRARALAVLPGEGAVVLFAPGDPAVALRWVVTPSDGRPPSAAAFTPDGRAALVGRFDGSLRRVPLPAPPADGAQRSGRGGRS